MAVVSSRLPYGRQTIDDDDVAAVAAALRSDWLTTGPAVDRFEAAMARATGSRHAVAVSSGTAALHAMMHASGVQQGVEVLVPAITFVSSANVVVMLGGVPVPVDVAADTLLIDAAAVERAITPRTRAILAVDYAGLPADYDALQAIADRRGLMLLADCCHSLGATYRGRPAGSLARLSAFSFHPVKHITTGEGGCVTTDDSDLAAAARRFRNHGIGTDHRMRTAQGTFAYEMTELGYNYRLSDIQCALGESQLRHLPQWVEQRRALAGCYDRALAALAGVVPLASRADTSHAYHLYVVRLTDADADTRSRVFAAMTADGIGVNVHYLPFYLHPYYRSRFNTHPGMCPTAEAAYDQLLTLPLFPSMTEADVLRVVAALRRAMESRHKL